MPFADNKSNAIARIPLREVREVRRSPTITGG
jgi:hypothetical protein